MPTCCAVGCSDSVKSGFKLYRLPVGKRNAERRKQWLHRIGRDKWIPNENSKLCEVHFTEDQFENHRADKRRLLKQTAVPSVFSHLLPQKSRKPSKYVLLKDSLINASYSVDFSMGDKNGNDDQVSVEAPEFEDVLSENAPVLDQLLEGNEMTLSTHECAVNGDSKKKSRILKES
ncbi:hypothetical protein AVEN_33507-1 [Araneus ventricosus]|uniref:THAP-type domain-containing protein n=1 Tax=Araneus ventricosus TaxID=182803 RepID=A0A4Y2L4Y2_ARAVE|nr:hypothetical protein AVEN_33507-1 [Araneus ventricosus]